MITRRLVSPCYPYVPITVRVGRATIELEALLDTGFDGRLILPMTLIPDDAPPRFDQTWTLADGSTVSAPTYAGTVAVGHLAIFEVNIAALGEEALIGRKLLDNFRVILDFGRRVILER